MTQPKFPIAPLHAGVAEVTERIRARSQHSWHDYLARMQAARGALGRANFAHGFAAANPDDKWPTRMAWAGNCSALSAAGDAESGALSCFA